MLWIVEPWNSELAKVLCESSVIKDLNLIVPGGVILNDIVVNVAEHFARHTLSEL